MHIRAYESRRSADISLNPWSLLILNRHSPQAASSRLRTWQYIPYLEKLGAEVRVAPFFDGAYLETLYRTRQRRVPQVAGAYMRRLLTFSKMRKASVVWIEKELFPYLPGWFETLPRRLGVPYAVDYDDATFHTYDTSPNAMVSRMLSSKLDPLIAGAAAVTAGSAYLQAYAEAHGARSVLRLPTVVDLTRYSVRPESTGDEIRIGWIGTPATMGYLRGLQEPLREVARQRKIRLVTVGAGPLPDMGFPLEQHEWSAQREDELIGTFHIGVMPLPDAPWERGKCGYKLIQYMAAGRPVIASPVGANRDIVTTDVGILADGSANWVQALTRMIDDSEMRCRMGARARAHVEASYSLQSTAPRLGALLSGLALRH